MNKTHPKLIEKFEQVNYSQNKSYNNTKAIQSAIIASEICHKFNLWCDTNLWAYDYNRNAYRQYSTKNKDEWQYIPFDELYGLFLEEIEL